MQYNSIGEKLDFLMRLTDTQNTALGRVLSFDPSYISRIRSGKRGIPRLQPFIEPASSYFAKNIREDYQISSASRVILKGEPWPSDPDAAANSIVTWLSESKSTGYSASPEAEDNVEEASPKAPQAASNNALGAVSLFYGNSGKRSADEILLLDALSSDKPGTLLLHSDENVSWLFEDPQWTKKWAELMIRFLAGGGHIQIVHDIGRSIGDMLEALKKWIPLYMYGGIEPYYCPRVRDGIYHRTLQLSRGRMAVISSSVGGNTAGKLNLLIRDKNALRALEGEWNDFLALCRPLMEIYGTNNRRGLKQKLKEFSSAEGSISIKPESVVEVFYNERLGALVYFDNPESPLAFLIKESRLSSSIAEYISRMK